MKERYEAVIFMLLNCPLEFQVDWVTKSPVIVTSTIRVKRIHEEVLQHFKTKMKSWMIWKLIMSEQGEQL